MTDIMTNKTEPKPEFTSAGDNKPDLSFSTVTKEGSRTIWQPYLNVKLVQEGYYKGQTEDGKTIIVQTLKAKNDLLVAQGITPTAKQVPELYFYEEEMEDGQAIWTDMFALWKGKKDGYFNGKTPDGDDIVGQTREAKEAQLKQRTKQVAPINLNAPLTADV